MKTFLLLGTALLAGGWLCAQEKAPGAPTTIQIPVPASATPAPAPAVAAQAEMYMLQVEPRAMRVGHSLTLADARHTVFTPARRVAGKAGLEPYSKADFAKLGISPDTFAERARQTADRLLATLKPDLIKDDSGRIRYAVYRGADPMFAALIVAPSLAKVFTNIFGNGKEVWVAAPDRHALYVFPPNPAIVNDFAADLADRFESEAFAATEEVFIINGNGEMKAVGTVRER